MSKDTWKTIQLFTAYALLVGVVVALSFQLQRVEEALKEDVAQQTEFFRATECEIQTTRRTVAQAELDFLAAKGEVAPRDVPVLLNLLAPISSGC